MDATVASNYFGKTRRPSAPVGVYNVLKNPVLVPGVLFGLCSLLYYFEQLIALTGWDTVRWQFFYTVHDIHRLLFMVPIIWTAYFFGVKATAFIIAASIVVFLPRAIWLSPYPDALLRMLLYCPGMITLGLVFAIYRKNLPKISAAFEKTNERPKTAEVDVFTARNLEIDLSRHLIKRNGQILKFTPKEYGLLSYLVRNNGKAISHKELLNKVWGMEYGQEKEYLRNYIMLIRGKIENEPSKPDFILTEPGFGYRFYRLD